MMRNRVLLTLVLLCLPFLLPSRPVVATVSATTNRATYSGNGTTTAFAFPYYFQKNADIKVWTYVVTSGAQVMKTLTTDYTVAGAGLSAGGTVTMLVAPPTGTTLVIYDDPDQIQNLSMSDSGPFSAKQIELRLDKLTLLGQRFSNQMSRALHLADGDASGFNPTLPVTITASAVFMSDPTGKFLVMGAQQASAAQTAQLIGGGDADPLHFHGSDRARANHTGTQLAATISNFSAAVLLAATPAAIGAVTSARTLNAGTGISGGGDLSADRTFSLANTTVTPAAYGSAILIPTFTVDAQGRLTAAATVAPAFTTTQLSASANIVGTQLSASANVLYSQLETRTLTAGTGLTGGGTLAADRTFTLANTAVTPASYGLAGSVPQITVDAQGRLTAAANVAISGLGDAALTNGAVYLKRDGTVAMTADFNFAGFTGTNFLLEAIAAGSIPAPITGNRGRMMFDVTANELVYLNATQVIRASENPSMAHAIPIAQNSPTVNFVLTYNGSNSVWAAAGAGSTIAVQSNGSLVTGSPAATLNFNGGLQAGNVAGGVSAVSIAAGGVTAAMLATGTYGAALALGTSTSDGVATTVARSDHTHAAPNVTENGNARGATTTLKLIGDLYSSSSGGTTSVTVTAVPFFGPTVTVSTTSALTAVVAKVDNIAAGFGVSSSVTETMILRNVEATVSIASAGPVINGRDQSGAFTDNTWIYLYVIGGTGQTSGFIWSANASRPTMPAGYTHSALIEPARQATAALISHVTVGRNVYYCEASGQVALSGGTATTFTATTLMSNFVPPITRAVSIQAIISSTSPGNAIQLKPYSGSLHGGTYFAKASVANIDFGVAFVMPTSETKQIFYKVTSAVADQAYIYVAGFAF